MRFLTRVLALAAAAIAALTAGAVAQSQQCDAWRGELARLERGGSGGGASAAAAQRVGAELSRAQSAYAGMQCGAAWIFQAPPAQCGQLGARIGQLRAQYASLQQGGGGNEGRRRALIAAINDNCRTGVFQTQPMMPPGAVAPAQPRAPRNIFEALFGVYDEEPRRPSMPELDGQPLTPQEPRTPSWGSGRPVCVRLCDGAFFPLSNSPGGRGGQQEMCQALCPGSETEVFYMAGSGNIDDAVNRSGRGYLTLANANRFTRQFDASCSCRKPGQSWAQALADAEEMIDRRRGDIMVSAQRAEEMSRPRVSPADQRAEARRRQQQHAALSAVTAEDNADARAIEQAGRNAPTAGTDSAGIAAGAINGATVGAGQGERREITTATGERRTVRIVAPTLSPIIQ
jgi:hypothetical protein